MITVTSLIVGGLLALFGLFFSKDSIDKAYIIIEEAMEYPGFHMQGEYKGQWIQQPGMPPVEASLQVAIDGNNRFRAVLYLGDLPGEVPYPVSEKDRWELEGTYDQHTLAIEEEAGRILQYDHRRFTLLDKNRNYQGHFDYVLRKSPTLGMAPPPNAIVLFDGTHLDHWTRASEMTPDGLLKEGARTRSDFHDIRLHVEAKMAFIPYTRRGLTNSGIYIQNRYEVQILDTYTLMPTINGNASLYNVYKPRINATYPPLTWQTYDVWFRAPRFDEDGNKTENARVTVYLNGVLEQYNKELESGTGGGARHPEVPEAEIYLQNHRDPVRFRNVWVVEEPYAPPSVLKLGTDR